MWGEITIDGRRYIERMHIYPLIVVIGAGGVPVEQRLVTEGDFDFILKYLTRFSATRFRCRLGCSDGMIWFSSGAANVAGANNRVRDDLMFGDGQFPFPVIPWIRVPKGAAILLELEDFPAAGVTIEFAFHGSKLIPA